MTSQNTKLNPEQDRLRLWQIAEQYAHNKQVTEAADILRVAYQLGQTTINPEHLASQEQARAETPFGYQSFSTHPHQRRERRARRKHQATVARVARTITSQRINLTHHHSTG